MYYSKTLILLFLIAGATVTRANSKESNSNDVVNYWKDVTNNQPLPEALESLLKEDRVSEKTKFEKDSNAMHFNYLRYKKDNELNNADPKVPGDHFTKTVQNDPNAMLVNYLRYKIDRGANDVHLNYLRYKKDSGPNNVDSKVQDRHHITKTVQNDPNAMLVNYLRYKIDRGLNVGVTGDHLTRTFQKDPNNVHLNYLRYKMDNFDSTSENDQNSMLVNYLRYKKDSEPDNVDSKVSGSHITKTIQNDPNSMLVNYLRYKIDGGASDGDTEVTGDRLTKMLQKDPNNVHLNYLRSKKNSQLNDVDPKVTGDHLTETFQKDPNGVHVNYLRYKKNSGPDNADSHITKAVQNDRNAVPVNYLRYKIGRGVNAGDTKVTGDHLTRAFQKDPNSVHFNYLRYKKDSQLNNVDPKLIGDHLSKSFQEDPNGVHLNLFLRYKKGVHLNYLRYKKDSGSDNVDSIKDHSTEMHTDDPKSLNSVYNRYKKESQLDKVEYGKLLVFTPSDLYLGKKFQTMFPYVSTSSSDSQFASPKFLPRHVAESVPFSSAQLPDILRRFGIQPDSPWAELVDETLKDCEAKGIMGETSFCATSLESLLDSARDTFGSNYETKFISTTHLGEISSIVPRPQKYTLVEAPKEIVAAKKMSCHPMTYLYPVFGCHMVKDAKLFRLLLEGEDGSKVDALAVCHMDTSDWSPEALFLVAAGLKPGAGAVCHFMQPNHLSVISSTLGGAATI